MKHDVLLGFGSNLGPSRETLRAAWSELAKVTNLEPVRISRFHRTRPIGGPSGQPDYWNAVGLVRTSLVPEELLRHTQAIENRFGRVRLEHWGPRTLDIDILLFGDLLVDLPSLRIPHPRMLERGFVLLPAMEIDPDRIHPETGRSLSDHCQDLGAID